MTTPEDVLDISCDESGNDGERLVDGSGTVFSHGSHDLSLEEASEIMDWLRSETRSQAPEFKFKQLARHCDPELLSELFEERLANRAHVNLSEKTYMVVGKVVDLLVEELAHSLGMNLYAGGKARAMALRFYREGGRALGTVGWMELLRAFNSLMRVNADKNGNKTTIEEFFKVVDTSRGNSKRLNVTTVLDLVFAARVHAEEFQEQLSDSALPALDPLPTSLAQIARFWHESSDRPIRVRHDVSPALRPETVDALVFSPRNPGEFVRLAPPVPLVEIVQVISESDPRIQVADLIAGFGAKVAMNALENSASPEDLRLLHPFLDQNSLWGDELSWKRMTRPV
ncbi:hypothetical protein E3O19_01800 [Cryobacterium algoritolerans]|uniref:DUF3800 domain-containing protein n=1 Tax=Cryobacterium algoritolerans TaxID=1259184 RepID=A0A4R8X1E1_9MICO|nr:DUF3800 domain-containing protein [Cryobacterium algoritolerans]TFC19720.1 hypothetical protein E3O19_01800 [Cryobacterium algoritolerans]